jgi:kumamolisin
MKKLEYRIPLLGSERTPLPGFHILRRTNPASIIHVTLLLRPGPHPLPLEPLEEMAARLPQERHYLTREEYAAAHGADPAGIHKVLQFAAAHGLKPEGVDKAARMVHLLGTAAAISQAFSVDLFVYQRIGSQSVQRYRGRTGPIYIPAELDGIVEAVMGLDDRPQARPYLRHRRQFGGAWPHAGRLSYSPDRVARYYNFPAGVTGQRQCIGIVALQGGYVLRDLRIYFERLGIPAPQIAAVSVQGAQNGPILDPNGPDSEAMLDIEVAGVIAPGARIVVYFAPSTASGFFRAIMRAIHDKFNRPSVISISWGGAEASWTPQSMQAFDHAFQAAGAMGITVCCAVGDRGSSDGYPGRLAHASFPASSPHVLACGGTSLNPEGDEIVWNDGPGSGASGGGVSDFFPLPLWQQNSCVPPSVNPNRHVGRGLPDVAGNAGPMTGYEVRIGGIDTVIGGTSAVAPLWAGLIALLNEKLGTSMGFLNPLLYERVAGTPGALRNVTRGHNDLTGRVGAYRASGGWNACTGWGTPDGMRLANALGKHQ